MIRRVVFVACAVICASCGAAGTPVESRSANPADGVTVDKLATFDDCVVYRVNAERSVYIARCGHSVSAQWDERHCVKAGKTMTCYNVPYESETVNQ